jgi:hypothetical protein
VTHETWTPLAYIHAVYCPQNRQLDPQSAGNRIDVLAKPRRAGGRLVWRRLGEDLQRADELLR